MILRSFYYTLFPKQQSKDQLVYVLNYLRKSPLSDGLLEARLLSLMDEYGYLKDLQRRNRTFSKTLNISTEERLEIMIALTDFVLKTSKDKEFLILLCIALGYSLEQSSDLVQTLWDGLESGQSVKTIKRRVVI